jgi:acyl-CoA hydrolase
LKFGRTSLTLYIEVRKHNVHTGLQDVVTHTNITFVKIDDDGNISGSYLIFNHK